MNLWDEIRPDDFEDDSMSLIIEVAGLSTAKKLVEAFGGDAFYFPKVESVIRKARDRRIAKEFTGFNHRELAVKYGLTTQHVRFILREARRNDPYRRKEIQLELF